MSYTVIQLITNGFYTSGIVAREFQQVTDTQVAEGLDYLNEILSDKVVEDDMIPYYSDFTFTGIVGQEKYFISGLIDNDTLVFYLDTIRYHMDKKQRIEYFDTARANNINSLPVIYHVERQMGGANIYVYFYPDRPYVFEGWGLFGLTSVAINQDLSLILDQFYINYLKYALAQRICVNYDYDVPNNLSKQLEWYQTNITKRSQQMDLKIRTISTLNKSYGLNYGQINLGKSWFVP